MYLFLFFYKIKRDVCVAFSLLDLSVEPLTVIVSAHGNVSVNAEFYKWL